MLSSAFRRTIVRSKDFKYGAAARQVLLEGVDRLANAVTITLGPKGRNVMIEQPFGSPKITKDGVTVAKAVELQDKWQDMGARLVLSVAQQTNEAAGDGTTTATLLTRELYREAIKSLASGLDPNELRKGMQIAVDTVVKELTKLTKQVTTHDEISQVATISANGDARIGGLIADAFKAVGKDGVITVQTGKTFDHKLELVEGMKLDHGFLAPFFITDAKTQKCEYEDPYILVTDYKVSSFAQLQPILEGVVRANRPLLIIAEEVDGDALAGLIVNKLKGALKVVPIKGPGFGDNRKATLQDIATWTSATVVSEGLGLKLEGATLEQLGRCKKVSVSRDSCIIIEGQSDKAALEGRVDEIRKQLQATESRFDKEKLQERLSRLTGGVAVINVGGNSEVEVGEAKDLIEDALNATRAAVEEGIVPGGGIALLQGARALAGLKGANLEQHTGIEIVRNAITEPVKQIAANAGESGSVIVENIVASSSPSYGFDAKTGQYGDLFQKGIVDPTKVVRLALVNAASIASSMTSVECLIAEGDEEKPILSKKKTDGV
jgi:chaperonin GroEL